MRRLLKREGEGDGGRDREERCAVACMLDVAYSTLERAKGDASCDFVCVGEMDWRPGECASGLCDDGSMALCPLENATFLSTLAMFGDVWRGRSCVNEDLLFLGFSDLQTECQMVAVRTNGGMSKLELCGAWRYGYLTMRPFSALAMFGAADRV